MPAPNAYQDLGGTDMRRILLVVSALAIPAAAASAGTIATASGAWASTPITCAKVTGSLTGTVHFKGCTTPLAKGNAVGTGLATGGTLSWQGKHPGSVSFTGSVTTPGQGSCPAGSKEYVASEVVSAVSGSAGVVFQVGDSVSGTACRTKAGALTVLSYSVTK